MKSVVVMGSNPTDVAFCALSETDMVQFLCKDMTINAWKQLLHICDYRQRHNGEPHLACVVINPDEEFTSGLERVLKSTGVLGLKNAPAQGTLIGNLSKAARWGIKITHRW